MADDNLHVNIHKHAVQLCGGIQSKRCCVCVRNDRVTRHSNNPIFAWVSHCGYRILSTNLLTVARYSLASVILWEQFSFLLMPQFHPPSLGIQAKHSTTPELSKSGGLFIFGLPALGKRKQNIWSCFAGKQAAGQNARRPIGAKICSSTAASC